MQTTDPLFLNALTGSVNVTFTADAWYDGLLKYQGLPLASVTVQGDESNGVEKTLTATVNTDEKVLFPKAFDDVLGAWGQEVNVKARMELPGNPYEFSLGWFPLTSVKPTDDFVQYQTRAKTKVWMQRGAQIQIQGADRAARIVDADMETAEQPPAGSTVYGEISRLCQGVIPTGQHRVSDKALSASVVYESKERMTAIDMVAKSVNAKAIVDESGLLVLVPRVLSGDVWHIPEGERGIVAKVERELSRDGFYNAAISTGTDPATGKAIIGRAYETSGVLRYGGPAGKVPYFHDSPLITTQEAADADAKTTLNNLIAKRTQNVVLQCPLNPALQLGDVGEWDAPMGTVSGRITKITWTAGAPMTLTSTIPFADAWRIA